MLIQQLETFVYVDLGSGRELEDIGALRAQLSALTQFPRQGLVSLKIFPTPALKTPQGNDEWEHHDG